MSTHSLQEVQDLIYERNKSREAELTSPPFIDESSFEFQRKTAKFWQTFVPYPRTPANPA